MDIKRIRERIDQLEHDIFILNMKDRWNESDYRASSTMHAELRNQYKLLRELEGVE